MSMTMKARNRFKIALVILLIIISAGSGCVAPISFDDAGNITMHGKILDFEGDYNNFTIEGVNSSYSQVLYDAEKNEWLPMEFEINPCQQLEVELDRHGENVTYGNFALTTTETKIIKWELNESGNWSKICEIDIE